ncbi:uncharacterized protein ACN2A1_014766 isoform 1-T2 [Glossina fuscipes fuscipes]
MQQNLACRLAHGNKAEGRENTKLSKPRIQTLIYLTIICTCNCGNHPGSQPRQPTLTSLVFQLSDNTISGRELNYTGVRTDADKEFGLSKGTTPQGCSCRIFFKKGFHQRVALLRLLCNNNQFCY